jgi:hypothetical protein
MDSAIALDGEEEIIDLNHQSQYYYLSFSPVAQPVEQAAVNRWVGGSSPSRGANKTMGY